MSQTLLINNADTVIQKNNNLYLETSFNYDISDLQPIQEWPAVISSDEQICS